MKTAATSSNETQIQYILERTKATRKELIRAIAMYEVSVREIMKCLDKKEHDLRCSI